MMEEALDKKWRTKSFVPFYQLLITGVAILSQNTENLKYLCYSLASPGLECCIFKCGAAGECGVGCGGQFGGVWEAGFMALPSSHRMP